MCTRACTRMRHSNNCYINERQATVVAMAAATMGSAITMEDTEEQSAYHQLIPPTGFSIHWNGRKRGSIIAVASDTCWPVEIAIGWNLFEDCYGGPPLFAITRIPDLSRTKSQKLGIFMTWFTFFKKKDKKI
ncbi:hypothetical protein TcWFU_002729 [Taenia crassiceps]|uniref:Uncharacterized protein n=1 Tax=Taenia crassiceps TaxID=6207 RepID=A0ABR4Q805_9CEST